MSHGDTIVRIPEGYTIMGNTSDVKIGALKFREKTLWYSVSPRSISYNRRPDSTEELCGGYLRMQAELDT